MKTASPTPARDHTLPHLRIAAIDQRIKHLEVTCFRRVRNVYGCARYGLDVLPRAQAGVYHRSWGN